MKNRLRHMREQFKMTGLLTFTILLLILCIAMLASCSNDDEPLPSYEVQLGELTTSPQGKALTLICDDGRTLHVKNDISGFTPDSLYRVQATFVTESEDNVSLSGLVSILSPFPREFKTDDIVTDPVEVVSTWRTSRYINARLSIARGDKERHYLGFMDEGTITHADGTRVKTLRLYHNAMGDPAHYRQEILASCPVYQYSDQLVAGKDSVVMLIEESSATHRFATLY